MRYILFDAGTPFNKKSHEIYYKYFANDPNITFAHLHYDVVKKTIMDNYDNEEFGVMFYDQCSSNHNMYIRIIEFINHVCENNVEEIRLKILFIIMDFYGSCYDERHIKGTNFLSQVFSAKNHYVLSMTPTMEQLNWFHGRDYSVYEDKIIFHHFWAAYEIAFIEYNECPKKKIGLPGSLGYNYPKRSYMLEFADYVERIPYDEYLRQNKDAIDDNSHNRRLNEYLCCYVSSGSTYNYTTCKKEEAHVIFLKLYEILAAGSLLLCSLSEKPFIEKQLGIKEGVHYLLCDCEDRLKTVEMCKYILDDVNRDVIDKIRREGQEYAKMYLNNDIMYEKFKCVLKSRGL